MESSSKLDFDSGATLAAAASTFLDSNTATQTALNLANAATLEIMANFGTGNGASVIAVRFAKIQLEN